LGFGIGLASQTVFQYNMADLLYLIRLRLVPFRLKVQNFLHSLSEKDVGMMNSEL